MSINTTYKSNVINTDPKVGMVKADDVANETSAAIIDETFGIPDVPGTENPSPVAANPFDDYLCGDTKGGRITNPTADDPGILKFMEEFPPSFEKLEEMNDRVAQYLDIVLGRYKQSKSDIIALKKSAEDTLFRGTVTAGEAAALQTKIAAYNQAMARCEAEIAKVEGLIEKHGNIYLEELRTGKDLNGDRWIGRPHHEGSYGIHKLENGKTVYIDPITGTALASPPYSNPDYEPILADGNVRLASADDVPAVNGHPTADVTLQLTGASPAGNDYNTAFQAHGVQYFWVERDGKSFDPEMDFIVPYTDSDDPKAVATEPHYKLAVFESVDGKIRQTTPANLSRYIQIEVKETRVTSHPVDGGKGFDHFVEYFDAKGILIARMRITGYDLDHGVPCGRPLGKTTGVIETEEGAMSAITYDPSGPSRVYASTLGFAFNTDNVYASAMKYDFSGFKSTGRHIQGSVEGLAAALGIKVPSKSDEKAYRAFMENMELFATEDYSMELWLSYNDGKTPGHWEGTKRDFDYKGGNTIYIDPTADRQSASTLIRTYEGRRADNARLDQLDGARDDQANSYELMRNNKKAAFKEGATLTESVATPLTGIMIYGMGTRGHIIGTEYNDIIHVADANALFQNDYYRDRYPYAEPITSESPYYQTVVDARGGNNIVRGYAGDHHITGATLAWIDGKSGDNNHLVTQGISNSAVGYKDDGTPVSPVNPKHYIHVNAPGGEIAIHNPIEETLTMTGSNPGKTEHAESPWMHSTYDDYYNLNGGQLFFTNLDDLDAIEAAGGHGKLNDRSQMDFVDMRTAAGDAADKIWEEIIRIEQPDNIQQYVDAWKLQAGHTAEMQAEMDDFFGTMFGTADDLMLEFAEEQARIA